MKEYIEREAAVSMAHGYCHTKDGRCCGPDDVVELYEELKAIPAADVVEVRHGRWVDNEEDGHPSICCVCNYPVDRFYKTKYCPNCGAKMTEDRHEQKE